MGFLVATAAQFFVPRRRGSRASLGQPFRLAAWRPCARLGFGPRLSAPHGRTMQA
jgi:hypothetical protein